MRKLTTWTGPRLRLLALLLATSPGNCLQAAPAPASEATPTTLTPGIDRRAGTHSTSKIQYVRLILRGTLREAAPKTNEVPISTSPPPTLVAQCTLRPNGRYLFEMFLSFASAEDAGFQPPWVQATPRDLPPRTEKATVTMEFLGYTHVKPLRRQWEIPVETPKQYRYLPPAFGSPNLEEIAYDLRYLLALPTLRLSVGERAAEFVTTPLLDEIRREPLCRAAGL